MVSLNLSLNLGATNAGGSAAVSSPQSSQVTPPATPTTPAAPGAIPTGVTKKAWAMAVGETVYVNTREGSPGPLAWVAYVVAYVFGDGNAAIVRDPGFVAYTGDLEVGINLRRKSESYVDAYPGP